MAAAADPSPSRHRRLPSPAENHTAAGATSTASRRSLHNFSFPPTLSWRNQRVLRCVNLTAAGDHAAGEHAPSPSEPDPKPKPKPKRVEEEAESSPARPWNLRTRRANPNRTLNPNPNRSSPGSPSPPSPKMLQVEKRNSVKIVRSEGEEERDKGERCKFAISLKREEIEEDFLQMKGSKPPRRPKKRAKYIQRQLDSLFPCFWLSEITPELYKIDVEKTRGMSTQRYSRNLQDADCPM